jgi:CHAD domain-containing protein
MALDPDRVHKPVRKLRKLLRNLPKQPSADEVHDLRTNARRLEAILLALSLDSRKNGRRLLKGLTPIRKNAGKVRDMDVLTGVAAGVHPNGEQECTVQLLEHLGAWRRQTAKKLHVAVTNHGPSTRKRLKQTSLEIARMLCEDGDKACDAVPARAHATASALTMESQLVIPARLTKKNLHPYRLKVKELHNLLRMADNSSDNDFVQALGRVKDAIGEWHDWEELLAIANDVLNHGTKCDLLRHLRKISSEKYEDAVSQAESMRKKYLRNSSGRTRGIEHPSEPAWSATASLAA